MLLYYDVSYLVNKLSLSLYLSPSISLSLSNNVEGKREQTRLHKGF